MDKNVRYFKLRNDKLNQDSIVKMTLTGDNISLTLELNFVLYKSGNEYKKYLQCGTNLILSLEASFINNKLQLQGGPGRIFEIIDFNVPEYGLFEFKSLGLFSYFTSYLLTTMINKNNIAQNVNIVFIGSPKVSKDNSDFEDYNKMNFTRKLKTYRKLGFKLKKVAKNHYNLQDTPVSRLRDIELPKTIKFYDYALELINDAKELIPFANEKVKPLKDYGFYDFTDKEIITHDTLLDVTKIIGTDHPKYYQMTWIDAINNLRTPFNVENQKLYNDSNIFYKINKDYESCKDAWGIKIVKGKHYISEGNHRTILSKLLNALDLIDDNVNGLNYIKQFEVNEKEKIKYHAILRWLRIYYPNYHIELSVRNEEIKNLTNSNIEELYYERKYHIFTHYSSTKDDELIHNYISFNDIKALRTYIKLELNENRMIHNLNYRMDKILKMFKKTKKEDRFNDEENN